MRVSELYLVKAATLNLSHRGRTFHCGAGGGGGGVAGKEGCAPPRKLSHGQQLVR